MRRRNKRIVLLVFAVLAISLVVVFLFRKKIIQRFAPDIEQLGNVRVNVVNDSTFVRARLALHNKTFLNIGVDTLSYVISLFGKTYIENSTDIDIHMPAYGHDTINFDFIIPHKQLMHDAKKARMQDDSTSYAIDASIQFVTFFGKFDIPVSKYSKIKIPEPPELEILEMKYEHLGLRNIRALATVRVKNKNEVALSIRKLHYDLKILSRAHVEGEFEENIKIRPRDETIFELPLEIHLENVGKTVYDVLTNHDQYDFTLHLVASIHATEPIVQTFKVDVQNTGRMELKK